MLIATQLQQTSRANLASIMYLRAAVRRGADTVRVSAQLIDAQTDGCVAAMSFDRPASELLSLQNDLIEEIINHLGSEINLAQVRRIEERAGVTPMAFESYACARAALAEKGWNAQGLGEAIAHLERATDQDENFAPAIAQLALLKGLAVVNKIFDEDPEIGHTGYCGARPPRVKSRPAIFRRIGVCRLRALRCWRT